MTELTGKCRIMFSLYFNDIGQQWVNDQYQIDEIFSELPDSMKFGVYQDFFDSVGIYTRTEDHYDRMNGYLRGYYGVITDKYGTTKDEEVHNGANGVFETREEARNATRDYVNELFNQRR